MYVKNQCLIGIQGTLFMVKQWLTHAESDCVRRTIWSLTIGNPDRNKHGMEEPSTLGKLGKHLQREQGIEIRYLKEQEQKIWES